MRPLFIIGFLVIGSFALFAPGNHFTLSEKLGAISFLFLISGAFISDF